ncbi:AAA-domain-containing protein [Trichocladium antarcticum]|uniref:AAA-domain-containing protein n=1 Tax=Trichocladium antarcticum TaxID=1450529 RepID=A0AAN6UDA4_9PEZI|nr:AAA-domain-containing protein [Trichocladium antarcticum]
MAGGSNYRFGCPLCKHTLSPVQVERLACLIAPGRTPTSLSGISISAGFLAGSSAKPAAIPKPALPFLGTPNKTKFPGGLSNAAQPDDSSAVHKEALMNSIVSKKPNVKWNDVAGLTPAKHELQRAIVFPARFPNLYDEKRKASGAILLYGPPGTGKSYLAKAVATEVDHTLFSISSGDVVSKWVGESEKLVRQLFTLARENKPSIIFIDEIDALCASREGGGGERGSEHSSRMKTEILVQLDGLHSGSDNTGVVVLAATNLPWALDPAFRRRFEPRIHIPLPDKDARRQLFAIHSGKWGEMLSEGDVEELAEMTEGFSGSDIANVVKHALSVPLQKVQGASWFRATGSSGAELYTLCGPDEEGATEMTWETVPKNSLWEPPVTAADFKQVLRDRRVKSSVGVSELQRYVDWTREFGIEGNK